MIEPMAVTVHDGLVSAAMVSELFDAIHQPVYHFGQKSNPEDPFGFWIANIPRELIDGDNPIAALWRLVDTQIAHGQCDIERMYVNAYTYGDCPTIHVDSHEPGHYTVLYYANEEWDIKWSGETVFYNAERDEIIKAVVPRPGRISVFDGRVPHVAREPNRIAPVVRYTIAIKLTMKLAKI